MSTALLRCSLGFGAAAMLWACATSGERARESSPEVKVNSVGAEQTSPSRPATPREDAVRVEPALTTEVAKAAVGERFIDFTAFNTGGEELRLSEHVGKKIVALQFWGLRCSPCLAEMGFLSELQREFEGKIQVLGVNTDRVADRALSQAMVARHVEVTYPVVADPDFDISQHYTQWLIPLTVLIDRKGTVRAILTGFSEPMKSELRGEMTKLMGEE